MTKSNKKKILVGSLRQETNSFSPVKTRISDFEVYKGKEMLNHIASTSVFQKAGFEIIPTLYAYATPSGKVDEDAYMSFKSYILDCIPKDEKIDGVWLYLHGAMNVENIGSGEGLLVSEIRKKVGQDVPIAVALDFHANNTELLIKSSNIIYGYRTVPHEDSDETQIRAAQILLECIDKAILPESVMVKPPLLLPGEMVITSAEPAKSLIKELEVAEKQEGVLCASIFSGMPWADISNAGASVVIVGEKNCVAANEQAKRIAKLFWDARDKFKFEAEAAEPVVAVEKAANAAEDLVFISDSGDNVTAGAPGDSAYLLDILLQSNIQKTLVAGITDSRLVRKLSNSHNVLTENRIKFKLGGELDKKNKSLELEGYVKTKGAVERKDDNSDTRFAVVNIGGVDVIVTDKRVAFTSPEIIESTGIKISNYKIVVVKLGYLYPDLKKIAKRSIIALTPGSSSLVIESFKFKNIRRPIFPLDKNFDWEP